MTVQKKRIQNDLAPGLQKLNGPEKTRMASTEARKRTNRQQKKQLKLPQGIHGLASTSPKSCQTMRHMIK